MDNYIRFDWAMKRLLRNKANHAVIEGLLESLLGRKYTLRDFSKANRTKKLKKTSLTVWTFLPKATREN